MAKVADEFVCLETPKEFHGVGQFYSDFAQVTDEAVTGLLAQNRTGIGANNVTIPIEGLRLDGNLTIPDGAAGKTTTGQIGSTVSMQHMSQRGSGQ
jgi:putative phosphoribosyl transferase